MNGKDSYYIFHRNAVYLDREFKTWGEAYRAAKKLHRSAFIMSKSWYLRLREKERRGKAIRKHLPPDYPGKIKMPHPFTYIFRGAK